MGAEKTNADQARSYAVFHRCAVYYNSCTVGGYVTFLLVNPELNIFAAVAGSAFCLLLAFLVGIYFFWSPDRRAIYRDYSYAVIVPLSLAEHRQNLSSQVYPRRMWIVGIVTMVVTAAVTVGIFILSNLIGAE